MSLKIEDVWIDGTNHLIYKMAIRLMEIRSKEISEHIERIKGAEMTFDTIVKLKDKKRKIEEHIVLFKRALDENNQDQIRSDFRTLVSLDLF